MLEKVKIYNWKSSKMFTCNIEYMHNCTQTQKNWNSDSYKFFSTKWTSKNFYRHIARHTQFLLQVCFNNSVFSFHAYLCNRIFVIRTIARCQTPSDTVVHMKTRCNSHDFVLLQLQKKTDTKRYVISKDERNHHSVGRRRITVTKFHFCCRQ